MRGRSGGIGVGGWGVGGWGVGWGGVGVGVGVVVGTWVGGWVVVGLWWVAAAKTERQRGTAEGRVCVCWGRYNHPTTPTETTQSRETQPYAPPPKQRKPKQNPSTQSAHLPRPPPLGDLYLHEPVHGGVDGGEVHVDDRVALLAVRLFDGVLEQGDGLGWVGVGGCKD